MNALTNLLWAIVLVVGLSLAMTAAGITLHDDYDGKQVMTLLECQDLGQKAVTKPNGIFFQQSLTCE